MLLLCLQILWVPWLRVLVLHAGNINANAAAVKADAVVL